MRIRLLFFASYRDLAGGEELELHAEPGATAGAVVDALRRRGGGLGRLPAAPAVAVNRVHSPLSTLLHEGDELALLPPVAGG